MLGASSCEPEARKEASIKGRVICWRLDCDHILLMLRAGDWFPAESMSLCSQDKSDRTCMFLKQPFEFETLVLGDMAGVFEGSIKQPLHG
eukprot:s408_g5.t1